MIYTKLDWYSCMLYNTTIAKILQKLSVDLEIYEELLGSVYERSYGFSSNAIFSVHGVTCELRWDDYLSSEQGSIFETEFSKIRLDISGQGLDYLRQFFPVDTFLSTLDFWGTPGEDYKVTRADFAFDFVNYQPGFLDTFLNWIKDEERIGNLSPRAARLVCRGTKAVQYSYRCGGNEKTLYLGSTRGDKLLRIYDKLLQYSKNGVVTKPLPKIFDSEGEVISWFRLEFQTRRKSADTYLFNINNDLSRVLRVVFDEYMIKDKEGKPLDFLLELYDWGKLPKIIQNAKFDNKERVLDQAYSYVTGQARRSIILCIAKFGLLGFVEEINRSLREMYSKSYESVSACRGTIALNNKIAQMCVEENISLDELAGLKKEGNFYFIKVKEKKNVYVDGI